jgi:hypothetical protein
MTLSSRERRARIVALILFLLALATPLQAQVRQGYAKEGGFVAVTFVPGFTFDGVTFDGESGYKEVDGEELFILPRLDKQDLFRGILGYRARQVSLEISYERTQHDGTFEDFPVDSVYQAVNVDGRYFFLPNSRVQPHVLVGGSFPWLRVKEGSFLDPDVGDARFRGYGINTEAGVTVYPHRQLGIGVGYSYRAVWFDRASGVSDRLGELRPRFRETSGSVAVTGTFTF